MSKFSYFFFVLKLLIIPSIGKTVTFLGVWGASLATLLIFIGIVIGGIIYFLGTAAKVRETEIFVGGEDTSKHPGMRISGTEFYNTIQDIGVLKAIYIHQVYRWGKIQRRYKECLLRQ